MMTYTQKIEAINAALRKLTTTIAALDNSMEGSHLTIDGTLKIIKLGSLFLISSPTISLTKTEGAIEFSWRDVCVPSGVDLSFVPLD